MEMIKDYGDYGYNYMESAEAYVCYRWNNQWDYEHSFETESEAQEYCERMQASHGMID